MNMQRRADVRSIALHREVVKKLRKNPRLWNIPIQNISRWKKRRGELAAAILEWEKILQKNSKDEILSMLESDSEESARLRSSSPFTGILTENERKLIFEFYRTR